MADISDEIDGDVDKDTEPTLAGPTLVDPGSDAAFFEAEGAVRSERDRQRAAEAYYQAGTIVERFGLGPQDLAGPDVVPDPGEPPASRGAIREASRLFARALSLDPSHRPTLWALRRIARSRALWQDLLRLYDAEARFAVFPRGVDRAELLVARGRVLDDELGRRDDALASYRDALEAEPASPAALLASLYASLSVKTDTARLLETHVVVAERALAGLAALTEGSLLGVAFQVERARAVRRAGPFGVEATARPIGGPGTDRAAVEREGCGRALGSLITAYTGHPFHAVSEHLWSEIERTSVLADDLEARLTVLDLFDRTFATPGREPSTSGQDAVWAGAMREKAALLHRRGDREGAIGVLHRVLGRFATHPLCRLDLLCMVRDDTDDQRLSDRLAGFFSAEAVALHRADVALGSGTVAVVPDVLRAIDAANPWFEASLVTRVRAAVAGGDGEALATLFETIADRHADAGLNPPQAPPSAATDDRRAEINEAAHFLVRAGALREVILGDRANAEALYQRALVLRPEYRPAIEGLASVFTRAGRWPDLVELVASDARALTGAADRAAAFCESLLLLNRDVLRDHGAALSAQRQLVAAGRVGGGRGAPGPAASGDLRALFRWVDAAGLAALVSGHDRAVVDELLAGIEELCAEITQPSVQAGWQLVAARVCRRAGRDDQERAWLQRALAADARSGAAAAIEDAPSADAAVWVDALEREAEAWEEAAAVGAEKADAHARARAVRFRLAFLRLERGEVVDALAVLDPLRRRGDGLASVWMLDIARRDHNPRVVLSACGLADPAATAGPGPVGSEGAPAPWVSNLAALRVDALLAIGDSFELAGRRGEARQAFETAADLGTRPRDRLAAAFGRLRCAAPLGAERSGRAELAAAQRALAAVVSGNVGRAFLRAARVCEHLSAGTSPRENVFPTAADQTDTERAESAIMDWLLPAPGVGDTKAGRTAALAALATVAGDRAPAASLWFAVAARLAFQEQGQGAAPGPADKAADTGGALAHVLAAPALDAKLHVAAVLLATDLPGADPRARQQARQHRIDRLLAAGPPEASATVFSLLLDAGVEAEGAGNARDAQAAYARALDMVPDSLSALAGIYRIAAASPRQRRRTLAARALARIGDVLRTPAPAARAWREAAELFVVLGNGPQAVALLGKAFVVDPDDDQLFARLSTLLRASGDLDRLERCIGFKITRRRATGSDKDVVSLYLERARIRCERPDRVRAAMDDYKRVIGRDDKNLEALSALGRDALARSRFAAAVHYLRRASEVCSGDPDVARRAEFLVRLSEAHEGEADPISAVACLRQAIAIVPGGAASERLAALFVRQGRHEDAITTLRDSVPVGTGASNPARAIVELHVARLAREHMADEPRALAAILRALDLDPTGGAAADLADHLARAPDIAPETRAVIDQGERRLVSALSDRPVDAVRLERLSILARLSGRAWRADFAEQVAALLEQGSAAARSPKVAGRLDRNRLIGFADEPDAGAALMFSVWPRVSAAFARVFETVRPRDHKGSGRMRRIFRSDEPRLTWIESLAAALELPDAEIHLSGDDLLVEPLSLAGAPAGLIIGAGILGGDTATRFRVGNVLALVRLDAGFAAPGSDVNDTEIGRWLSATAALTGARRGNAEAADKDLVKAVSKAVPRREQKALAQFREAFEGTRVDAAIWLRAVRRIGRRFGLAVGGDLAAAVRILAGSIVSAADIERSDDALDLIRFALDDRFAELQRDLGVGEIKPGGMPEVVSP